MNLPDKKHSIIKWSLHYCKANHRALRIKEEYERNAK